MGTGNLYSMGIHTDLKRNSAKTQPTTRGPELGDEIEEVRDQS